MKKLLYAVVAATALSAMFLAGLAQAQEVPAPGKSARIDAIKEAGELRVGVLANPPWLVEDTTGSGERWRGPAWSLAQTYADDLGVKLVPVLVSHETKVPVLAANQVDMTISPLSMTKQRQEVVDFVTYSRTSLCVFGKASNPKVSEAKSVDDFNRPEVTIAYFTGGGEENWVKERFPNATLRGVTSAGTAAPMEEIMAGRADVAPINRIPFIALSNNVKGLEALPRENNCQDSTEAVNEIGLAIDKNQPEYLEWLQAVTEPKLPELLKLEEAEVAKM
ncbi:transporter substrate-binding domain-containing protein [Falsochrobactrum sp. TDYN1]|uniref:Transporter substrate-binding domain-containing protein n=1 Tax=Falsochrobactrum tianjinense TaxID=2706015 RepID=A0A949PLU7_9HYPH|nr:transporter substrate-binding domain-containing protein [Falsochrobactrum sp. TDYN1]MBV2142983.1 transporter substrate-binding domain-containing protein [Falsochrobactrum sp. TDYN1]